MDPRKDHSLLIDLDTQSITIKSMSTWWGDLFEETRRRKHRATRISQRGESWRKVKHRYKKK